MILSFAQHEMDTLSGVLDTAFGCRVRLRNILQFLLNFLFGSTQDAIS